MPASLPFEGEEEGVPFSPEEAGPFSSPERVFTTGWRKEKESFCSQKRRTLTAVVLVRDFSAAWMMPVSLGRKA